MNSKVASLPAIEVSPPLPLRPFLRWAGGKQRLIYQLLRFVPRPEMFSCYFEPFVGAASMCFAVQPRQPVLGDINGDLINCYQQIANSPYSISKLLAKYASLHSRDFFYEIRRLSRSQLTLRERAARFIYLNKSAFNGIYRVNKKGNFNVPFGPTRAGLSLPSLDGLIDAAACLRRGRLRASDFEECVRDARPGDFVYLDPPYPPRSKTAFFVHYSLERFDWQQQQRVAEVFRCLSNRGCLVMLSNAEQGQVRSLYRDFQTHRLDTLRWLGSNGDRYPVRELVVTNYRITRGNSK